MVKSSIQERVILHLGNYKNLEQNRAVPYAVSQQGIAKSVDGSRSHVSRVLRDLKERNLIKETRKYLKNDQRRKRKAYFLTTNGRKKEKKIRNRFKNKYVFFKTDGEKSRKKIEDLNNYIEKEDHILYALINSNENDVVNLSHNKGSFRFVDRKKSMNILKDGLSKCKKESGISLFIEGKAGTGKTTLVKEFKNHAEKKGFDFLMGKSYHKTADPYLPLKKAFTGYKNKKSKLSPLEILEESPSLEATGKDEFTYDANRRSIFFKFTNKLKKISNNNPFVLFLDDLQWSDTTTLHLLYYMIDNLSDSPIFFIGAYRSESISKNHPVKEINNKLSRSENHNKIILNELDRKYIREMVTSLTGQKNIPSDFVNFIYDISEGNPLFAKEFIELLEDKEKLPIDTSNYPTNEEQVDIPNIIEKLLKHRVDNQINEEAKQIAYLSSVIGQEIPYKLLKKCTKKDEMNLLNIIDELIRNDIWDEELDKDLFTFSHKLIKNVIYEEISRVKKKRLHNLIAENMGNVYKDKIKDYHSDIGYHYKDGGNSEKAIKHFLKAAERSEKIYAHENAINMYKEASELAKGDNKIRINEKLGEIYKLIGEYSKAIHYINKVIEETEKTNLRKRNLSKMAEIHIKKGEYKKALNSIDKGLSINKNDEVSTCQLLNAKGRVFFEKGNYDKAKEIFKKGEKIADKLKDENELSRALHNLGTLNLQIGNYDKSKKYIEKVVEIRENIDNKLGLSRSLNNLGNIHYLKGDIDKALNHYEKSLEIREEIDNKDGISSSLNNIGLIYMQKGKFDLALDYHKRSLEIKKQIDDKPGIAESYNNMGIIYENKGNLEKALEYYKFCKNIEEDIGDKSTLATSLNNIGNIHYKRGKNDLAQDYYQRSLNLNNKIGDKLGSIPPMNGLAKIHIEWKNYEKAKKFAEDSLGVSENIGAENKIGTAHKILGNIYRELGYLDKAKNEYKKGKNIFEDIGKSSDFFKLFYEYGLLFIKKDDFEKAKEYLNKSLNFFEEHSMNWWKNKCLNKLDEIQSK